MITYMEGPSGFSPYTTPVDVSLRVFDLSEPDLDLITDLIQAGRLTAGDVHAAGTRAGRADGDGEAELCVDGECWRNHAIFQDGASHTQDPLGFNQTGTITRFFFDNTPRPKAQSLSIVVWADGEEIVRYDGVVEYRVQRPHGWFCEPVCFHAEVVV